VTGLSKVAAPNFSAKRRQLPLLVLWVLLSSGCATLASSELFREINARQPPATPLGAIVDLLPGPVQTSAILVRATGMVAVVAVDGSHQLHYISVANDGTVKREILGAIGDGDSTRLDIIEHRGQLRILAGDKQFSRGVANVAWKETGGNRCAKFLPLDDQLFCAMVIKGEEIKSPVRKDWTVGWFILFPVVFWSNESAAKLVIAQESPAGWLIRAVIDGESPLDARMDFFAATNPSGQLQLLFSASRGGGIFGVFVGTAPGAAAAGYSGYDPELRYAQIQLRDFLVATQDDHPSDTPAQSKPWVSRTSALVEAPLMVWPSNHLFPLNRHFSNDSGSDALHGLLWAREMRVRANSREQNFATANGWFEVQLEAGRWRPAVEILSLSAPSLSWEIEDNFAILANRAAGTHHALLESCSIGFWDVTCQLAYFVSTSNQWSAPLVLGSSKFTYDGRALAVGDRDCIFATWVNADAKFVGRRIGRCDPVTIK